ncbi:hypothetical protein SAMD00023353_5100360 [Rosellinia necatrix]|uniref:HD domain-containing protein n=1 Tax=Rosellinia necatrix TaxID=77044 RepID=A0A1W2TR10_ROSNE|nr:hypothetical protein SAMD00023353_5100360 [Rosellinia necatrix]
MKVSTIVSGLALAGAALGVSIKPRYPTTIVAGVEVIDTPIVRAVRAFIEDYYKDYQPYLTNHLYRTWLFGAAAINGNATLKATLDLEVHAVGSMLHDLGWDIKPHSPYITADYTFEVDSGRFAMDWIKNWAAKNGAAAAWDEVRLQKVNLGIMLQTFIGGSDFVFADSHWIVKSVGFEFPVGESPLIPSKTYDAVWKAYSNNTLFRGTNYTFTNMAAYKPEVTYTTFLSDFGNNYVPGYSNKGRTLFSLIQGGLQGEIAEYPNVPFVQKLPPNGGNPLN